MVSQSLDSARQACPRLGFMKDDEVNNLLQNPSDLEKESHKIFNDATLHMQNGEIVGLKS
jgi:hypothetical protein